jgi:outer membrane protein assembly factor BamB
MLDDLLFPRTLGLIPTLLTLGPAALLAMLLPAVFGGLALWIRRWLVLLGIASANSTLFVAFFWFEGRLSQIGWDSVRLLWGALGLLAVFGAICSAVRWRQGNKTDPAPASRFWAKWGGFALGAVFLIGMALVGIEMCRHSALPPFWLQVLVFAAAGGVGGFMSISRHELLRNWPTEAMMLWTTAFAYAGLAIGLEPGHVGQNPLVRVVWTFEPVERGAIISSPRVCGDAVYVAAIEDFGSRTSGAVYRLNRFSGKVQWKFDDHGRMQHTYSTPCVADGQLFIGEGMHENFRCRLYCLEAATGRKLWDFETGGHIESSPCVAGGLVVFGAGDDGLYCLDATTGKKCWQFQGPFHLDASPAVAGGRVYAGSGISRNNKLTEVFCLGLDDGHEIWRRATDLPVWGSPVLEGEQVFFGLGNGRLIVTSPMAELPAGALLCLEARSGKPLWRFSADDAVLARAAVGPRHVYFGSRAGNCYCLDRQDGEMIWNRNLGSPIVTGPALDESDLYVVASGGRVYRLSAQSGDVQWTFDVATHTHSRPRLLASPALVAEESGDRHSIYVGTELANGINSAAVLYCLEDLSCLQD